jgi:hypothetical protein
LQRRPTSWPRAAARLGRALARAEAGRERARAALAGFDDAIPDLSERWFREDTFEHYGEHAEQIRVFNA